MIDDYTEEFAGVTDRLLRSGRFGLVLLDAAQRVSVKRGVIVDWIEAGRPVGDAIPFLVGYEDLLAGIADESAEPFNLPYIVLNSIDNPECDILSVDVFPCAGEGRVGLLFRDERRRHTVEQSLLQHRNELALEKREKQRLANILNTYKDVIDRDRFEGFIGSSLRMQAVYRIIESAASSDATVFISGESGTGKEVCAEAIHARSDRHRGPFIAVNCAAIPKELIESELFGHVKGAFTGAVSDRKGAASLADGGTLFLDEICEMDVDLQSKLLRFVQTRQIQRVGKSQLESVDVRIVCATNRNVSEEVKAGRFREDLYYRLHVIPMDLPPLRQREDDVIQLGETFLADFATREGKNFRRLSPDAEHLFRSHDWPGNVRELQNVIQRIVVLNDGEEVTADMVPLPRQGSEAGPSVGTAGDDSSPSYDAPVDMADAGVTPDMPETQTLAQVERDAIENAIERAGGNIRTAAVQLGIAPATIYRKIAAWRRGADA